MSVVALSSPLAPMAPYLGGLGVACTTPPGCDDHSSAWWMQPGKEKDRADLALTLNYMADSLSEAQLIARDIVVLLPDGRKITGSRTGPWTAALNLKKCGARLAADGPCPYRGGANGGGFSLAGKGLWIGLGLLVVAGGAFFLTRRK